MRAAACIVIVAACAAPRRYQPHPYAFNFVPFGVGQLENAQPGKALAFALAEAATAGVSAGIWIHLEDRYPGGVVPPEEAAHVRSLQQTEIGTGVAFCGVAAWGVIDAVAHWRPRVEVAPAPVAGGAGVAASWRY